MFDSFFEEFTKQAAEEIGNLAEAKFHAAFEKFMRSEIKLSFSEAEAAAQIGVEESTLAEMRRRQEINYYQVGRKVRYGIHHLQTLLESREVIRIPPRYQLNTSVALHGIESTPKLRKVG